MIKGSLGRLNLGRRPGAIEVVLRWRINPNSGIPTRIDIDIVILIFVSPKVNHVLTFIILLRESTIHIVLFTHRKSILAAAF